MAQKRRYPRRDTILYLQVYSKPERKPIARLVDISTEGALLLSETPFAIDEMFEAFLELPNLNSKETTEIACSFTPRWQKPDYNPDYILTGCKMDVFPQHKLLLEEFMRNYGFGGEASEFEE